MSNNFIPQFAKQVMLALELRRDLQPVRRANILIVSEWSVVSADKPIPERLSDEPGKILILLQVFAGLLYLPERV